MVKIIYKRFKWFRNEGFCFQRLSLFFNNSALNDALTYDRLQFPSKISLPRTKYVFDLTCILHQSVAFSIVSIMSMIVPSYLCNSTSVEIMSKMHLVGQHNYHFGKE